MLKIVRMFAHMGYRMQAWLNWRQKIRTKIFLAVLLLCLLPMAILAFLTLRMGTSYVLFSAAQENHENAGRVAAMIDRYYMQKFSAVRNMPALEVRRLISSRRVRETFFASWMRESSDILAVSLATVSGDRIAYKTRDLTFNSPPLLSGQTLWSGRKLELEVGQVSFLPELGQPFVPLTVRLPKTGNDIDHIITCYMGLKPLEVLMQGLQINSDSDIYLEDSQGTLLLRSRFSSENKTGAHLFYYTKAASPRLIRATDNSTFSVVPYVNDRGIKVLGAYARCQTLGWGIFMERSAEEPFRHITNVRIMILAFSAVTFLFMLIGSLWFVGRLVRPIEDLEAGIKLVSSGLMGDELPIRSQDEIGRLTQTFNQMTRTMVLRTEEIRAKTRELTFFNTITRIINQTVDLNSVLDSSLQKILQFLHATTGLIYIYQSAGKQMRLISHFGVGENFPTAKGHHDFILGPIQKVFVTGESQMIRDVNRPNDPLDIIRQESIRDLLLVPLRSKKHTLGVMAVGSRRRHTFHYRDLDLLVRIGDEIGVAVENSLLYAELQLKINELQEANQDLQKLDRFKSQFLSNVSHELRTPITSIKTYVELFLCDKIGALDDLQREKLSIVQRNVNNLLSLINDLLTLSRIENQQGLGGDIEVVAVQELADQVIADTVEMAKSKGLKLARAGHQEPFWVRVNRQRMQQVFQNLIANAIKFTEKGGITLTIEPYLPEAAQLPETANDNGAPRVKITFSDTGIGIPKSELGKVFQRFYQVDSSSTRKYVGTGLGLAIVKEILTAHHASIHVESQVGQGSRFWFTLPVISVSPPVKKR